MRLVNGASMRILAVVLLLTAACAGTSQQARSGPGSHDARPGLTRAQADEVVQHVLEAIETNDAAALATWLNRGASSRRFAESAIQEFERMLGRDRFVSFELITAQEDVPLGTMRAYSYDLVTASGRRHRLYVNFDRRVEVQSNVISYAYRARALVDSIISAIQHRDADRLARLLNPDDLHYPVPLAAEAIARYHDTYEGDSLRVIPRGLDEAGNFFRFTVSGSRGGTIRSHDVRVIFGDGLVGIRDPLIPQAPQP